MCVTLFFQQKTCPFSVEINSKKLNVQSPDKAGQSYTLNSLAHYYFQEVIKCPTSLGFGQTYGKNNWKLVSGWQLLPALQCNSLTVWCKYNFWGRTNETQVTYPVLLRSNDVIAGLREVSARGVEDKQLPSLVHHPHLLQCQPPLS